MKAMFVIFILAGGMLGLIIFLDILLGTEPKRLFGKALNPFRVMEPAEYVIVFFFAFFLAVSLVKSFLKKRKKQNNPQTN
ncbi:hypothetical protein [Neobacillus cucumis]|uniref:hypothetical protein n=1 Tax=Neobacillus cucumis TaxID=1740721 RepID=UPI0028530B86|nr:hypothetical protein [Neobacillus cucumis]MDR4946885.1 hypothetical protein [Neobacillus cucumis]